MKEWTLTGVELLVTAIAAMTRRRNGDALVADARRGDVRSFERLLELHDGQMRALAFRMLESVTSMDDVLQDAYVRAFGKLDGFKGEAAFGTWLHRIVANACLDELRRTARRPQVELDEAADHTGPDRPFDEASAQRLDLAAALAQLEPELRLVVLMIDADGFSYDDVARTLSIPAGTVASRLHRARAALRPHLASTYGGSRS